MGAPGQQVDGNYDPLAGGQVYDPSSHQYMAAQAGTVTTDSTSGVKYATTLMEHLTKAGSDGQTASGVGMMAVGKYNGATIDRERIISKFVQVKAQAVTAGTPVDVYTPTTGKKFRILGYDLGLSVAGSILLEDTTGVEVLRTGTMAANTGKSSGPMGEGILSSAANNHLFLDVTASGTINGWIGICEE